MRCWLVIATVAMLGATAHAQAPGLVAPQPAGVMADRWAVGLAIGGESVTPRTGDSPPNAGFGVIELAARYRVRSDIELALTLGGGGNNDVSTGGLYFDFRYRFLAERAWNVIALAGLGVEAVGPKNGADDQRKARGSLRIGGGVERRFGRFALEADLRLFVVAENKDAVQLDEVLTTADELARYGVSGLSLTLGGTYYF